MNRTAALLTLALACAAVPAAAQPTARGPEECAALRNLDLPGVPISEVTAEWIAAGPAPLVGVPPVTLPAYCRVQATLNRRQGADGQQYGIGLRSPFRSTGVDAFSSREAVGSTGLFSPRSVQVRQAGCLH